MAQHKRFARWTVGIVAVACAMVSTAAAQPAAGPRLLVMPFDNVKRDTALVWIGEASAILLADGLNARGAAAITREERREAFDRLQVPPIAMLTDATVIRIAQLVGASEVVTGSIQIEGGTLVVHARGIALDTGRINHDVIERGPMADMFAIYDRVARRFAPPDARTNQRPSPPLPVFENYIKGLLADQPATAISYLKLAVGAMPTFDRARLALWDVYNEQGDHASALAAVTPVAADAPGWRRAKFLAGLSNLQLKRHDEAFAAFKALVDAQATATALNNLGVVQLRRAATAQTGLPTYFFNKAAELDGDDPDYFFNLGYAYWLARDTQAAIYWLREAVRRNPADGDAHYILGTALGTSGSAAEATRERELARRLSSTYEQWEKRPPAEAVPKGLERVKDGVELPHASQIETALQSTEQRDQRELTRFHLDRARRLYQQENDPDAMVELNRAIYLSPYEAEALLMVGRIHLRHNRVREAIDAFKIALWSSETAAAHLALGEAYLQNQDAASARIEADRALTLEPTSAAAQQLLRRTNTP